MIPKTAMLDQKIYGPTLPFRQPTRYASYFMLVLLLFTYREQQYIFFENIICKWHTVYPLFCFVRSSHDGSFVKCWWTPSDDQNYRVVSSSTVLNYSSALSPPCGRRLNWATVKPNTLYSSFFFLARLERKWKYFIRKTPFYAIYCCYFTVT